MNKIDEAFRQAKSKGEKTLITYFTAGHPDLASIPDLIGALAAAGADIIEVGVPFSDPVADGPVIQQASEVAISKGASLEKILPAIAAARINHQVPLVLFSYFNPILAYGLARFCEEAKNAGVDAVLVVDLPPEEAGELRGFADHLGLYVINLIAPPTPQDRVRAIAAKARGFLYLVSVTGVTGSVAPILDSLKGTVAKIRKNTSLPLVVGFGITSPSQAAMIAPLAEGIVVGSALVECIENNAGQANFLPKVYDFVKAFKESIRQSGHVSV